MVTSVSDDPSSRDKLLEKKLVQMCCLDILLRVLRKSARPGIQGMWTGCVKDINS